MITTAEFKNYLMKKNNFIYLAVGTKINYSFDTIETLPIIGRHPIVNEKTFAEHKEQVKKLADKLMLIQS